jgi:non-ribosomal peptide synthetase component E (peptide arylation enzyme)
MGSLTDYLDKGASLGRDAPCLVEGDRSLSYGDVQDLSHRVAGALARDGIEPGAKVGILRTTPSRSRACSASPAAARCGARSTRATSWPKPARCSSSSTASA